MPEPYTQRHVLATTKMYELLAADPSALLLSRHCTLTAHRIVTIPQDWPADILVSSSSDSKPNFPKHIIFTNTAPSANVIYAITSTAQTVVPIETPQIDINLSINLKLMENPTQHRSLRYSTSLHKTENQKCRVMPS